MGAAAVGVPALVNSLVNRRARLMPAVRWGSNDRYAWRHGDVAYQCLGEGDPLVLLHSFGPGHSASEWRRAAEILARSHRVYALDLLGWGASDMPILTYDGELYIGLIGDFLDDIVGGRADLVSAGLSAAYAAQMAVDHPERVRNLGLVVPQGLEVNGDEPDLKDAIVHRFLRLPVIGTSALNLFTSRSALTNYLRREVYASPQAVDDRLIDEHYRGSHDPGARASLAAYLSGYLNHGVRDILGRLDRPTWIAWGRHAGTSAIESADLWLHQLGNAELEVFEHAGSLPHAESPDEFCQKLEQFLAEKS